MQEIGWFWRIETWIYVAGARHRTFCENRDRRIILWTLPKRWQACIIRRIAFYVAGAGNPHRGAYVLRSKGSIPEKGCVFGTWTWGSICVAGVAFRMTSGHDFVAGAILLKHVSIFVEVSQKTLVLEVRLFNFRGSLAQSARFGAPDFQFLGKSRRKRSFWKSGSSVFEEVSHKALVLEGQIFNFRGSLAQNARLRTPASQFSGGPPTWFSTIFRTNNKNLLLFKIRFGHFVQNQACLNNSTWPLCPFLKITSRKKRAFLKDSPGHIVTKPGDSTWPPSAKQAFLKDSTYPLVALCKNQAFPIGHFVQNQAFLKESAWALCAKQAFLKDSTGRLCAQQVFLEDSTWPLCAKQAFLKDSLWLVCVKQAFLRDSTWPLCAKPGFS